MRPGYATLRLCAVLFLGLTLSAVRVASAERKYKVHVVSDPPGATLYIDDKEAGAVGKTPYKGKLTRGPHVLVLELDGYEPAVQDIEVKKRRKQQTFKIELAEVANGTVEVDGKPGDVGSLGAQILVDGEDKGELPEILELPAGAHQLEVRKKGFKPYDEWIEVTKGKTLKVVVTLQSLTANKKKSKKGKPGPKGTGPMFAAGAGVEMGFRSYGYEGSTAGMLLPIDTGAVAVFHILASVHPFARSRNVLLQRFSLAADLALAAPIESSTDDGMQTADSVWREVLVQARYAFPLSATVTAIPLLGYGQRLFTFDDGGVTGELPAVDYRQLSVGGDIVVRRGRLSGSVGADWLVPMSTGPLADRFRGASVSAYALRVGASAALRPRIELTIDGHYSRYKHTFTSMSGDMFEASGGVDRFFGVSVGAVYRH